MNRNMLAELPQLFFVSAYLLFMLSTIERETGEGGREKEERLCRELLADRNRHSQTPVMQSSCAQSQTYNVKVNMKSKIVLLCMIYWCT